MPDWLARIVRTVLQLLAGGAFAALFTQIAKDVPPAYGPYIIIITTLITTFAVTVVQNSVEQATGKAILKPANADVAKA